MFEEWRECQRRILAYLFFKGQPSDYLVAKSKLRKVFFEGAGQLLWGVMKHYYQETGGVLNLQQLRNYLRAKRVSEEKILELEQFVREIEEEAEDVDEGAFVWSLGRLSELFRELRFEEIVDKSEALLYEKGFDTAKSFFLQSLSQLEGIGGEVLPEGLLEEGISAFIEEVSQAKRRRREEAVDTGFPSLDRALLGLRPGDMCWVAGWTGCGKTTMLVNIAVDVVVNQKKNVVFVTTETVFRQLRRRIISRISKLPQFGAAPIPSSALKSGELSKEQRQTLLEIKKFLKEGGLGALMLVQAPSRATMDWLRGRLLHYEERFRVDVLLLDDIRNMTPYPRRRQEYEEMAQLVRDFKSIARSHADRGIPVISPYHVNRKAYEQARTEADHRYNLAHLASTAEAERLVDVVISMWQDLEDRNAIRLDFLKLRDGEIGRDINLLADFSYQYLEETNIGLENIEE